MPRAWARLAAYYYRDKPLQLTSRHVQSKNKVRQRLLANQPAESESEAETPPLQAPQNEPATNR